jgi:hypothetical protein
MAWAALDTFAMRFSWEVSCVSSSRRPPCYPADRTLLVLGVVWASLAFGMAIVLEAAVRAGRSSTLHPGVTPWLAAVAGLSVAIGVGTLPFLGRTGYEPLASGIGWTAFTAGFAAFALTTIWADRLLGRWARLARALTLSEGVVLMTFALAFVYTALGPPPVFA